MAEVKLDLKEIIEKAANAILKDDQLKTMFKNEPIKALEKILKVDLPDELLEPVIEGIKVKITADKLGDAANLLKKFF